MEQLLLALDNHARQLQGAFVLLAAPDAPLLTSTRHVEANSASPTEAGPGSGTGQLAPGLLPALLAQIMAGWVQGELEYAAFQVHCHATLQAQREGFIYAELGAAIVAAAETAVAVLGSEVPSAVVDAVQLLGSWLSEDGGVSRAAELAASLRLLQADGGEL